MEQTSSTSFSSQPAPSTSSCSPQVVQTLTPCKRQLVAGNQSLRSRVHGLRKKLSTSSKTPKTDKKKPSVDELCSGLQMYLKGHTLDFFATQLHVAQCKNKGQRWNAKDKSLALSLYHAGPKAYTLLQKLFCLPSIRTLRRTMQNIVLYPGLNEFLFTAFGKKVSAMTEKGKLWRILDILAAHSTLQIML